MRKRDGGATGQGRSACLCRASAMAGERPERWGQKRHRGGGRRAKVSTSGIQRETPQRPARDAAVGMWRRLSRRCGLAQSRSAKGSRLGGARRKSARLHWRHKTGKLNRCRRPRGAGFLPFPRFFAMMPAWKHRLSALASTTRNTLTPGIGTARGPCGTTRSGMTVSLRSLPRAQRFWTLDAGPAGLSQGISCKPGCA